MTEKPFTVEEKALLYLQKKLKKAKRSLKYAEIKQNPAEIASLLDKIEVLDWLAAVALNAAENANLEPFQGEENR